jgi:hypothetical protein
LSVTSILTSPVLLMEMRKPSIDALSEPLGMALQGVTSPGTYARVRARRACAQASAFGSARSRRARTGLARPLQNGLMRRPERVRMVPRSRLIASRRKVSRGSPLAAALPSLRHCRWPRIETCTRVLLQRLLAASAAGAVANAASAPSRRSAAPAERTARL